MRLYIEMKNNIQVNKTSILRVFLILTISITIDAVGMHLQTGIRNKYSI